MKTSPKTPPPLCSLQSPLKNIPQQAPKTHLSMPETLPTSLSPKQPRKIPISLPWKDILLKQPAILLPPRANESPPQKMPKNREKSEEKEKEQKEEGKHSNIERGHNAIKSKNLLHEDQRACKSDWWEDLNELKTQTPYTTNMQLIREKTRIKQTKIRSSFPP